MQLTELLYQKVRELAGPGQMALKSGYVAVVSRGTGLRAALQAALFPGPDDQRRLAIEGQGPTRVGVGLLGGDGVPYRVLRELGADRQLLRYDPKQKSFALVTDNALEIESFLRVQCGLPSPEHFAAFFCLDAKELPSTRERGAHGTEELVDNAKVKQLKEELETTRNYEGLQDRLFKAQQRIVELTAAQKEFDDARSALNDAEAQLARSPWSKEQIEQLTARATRAKEDVARRDAALAEINDKRQHAIRHMPPAAEPFVRSPWFGGGIAAGLAVDGAAFFLKHPAIALAGLLPWTAALVAVLRFIEADEADKQAAAYKKELKEHEESIRRRFKEEQAELQHAMRLANVDSARDLIEVFKEREQAVKKRDAAKAAFEKVKKNPLLPRVPIELPLAQNEKTQLEQQVLAQGFARPVGEIEADLKAALGLGPSRRAGMLVAESELPAHLVAHAAELLNLPPDQLWQEIHPRLSQYLQALTDRRVVSAKREGSAMILVAPDGKSGPFQKLPLPLRDHVYVALRLTLVERVAGYKRLPVVVDDAFGAFDLQKRELLARMLKGISTRTQVIHRVAERPGDGIADAVLQA